MFTAEDRTKMIEEFEQTFIDLDEEQRKIDNYRKVRKNDVEFQESLVYRQRELDHVRGRLVYWYAQLKRQQRDLD